MICVMLSLYRVKILSFYVLMNLTASRNFVTCLMYVAILYKG